ncbi:MAG TPA: phosphotransferase [Steroidobacteraceae bacterium]|nr:phosphotransferase [Steroidobacteraceae bacterium]
MSQSVSVDTITDASYVSRVVSESLVAKGVLQKPVSLERHSVGGGVRDSKAVFLGKGAPGLVVIVSPSEFPGVVAEECRKAAEMRSLLGDLGAPILEPMDTGRIDRSTYAVLPYRRPLSQKRIIGRLDLLRMQRHICNWLLQVVQRHGAATDVARYQHALSALARLIAPQSPAAASLPSAQRHLASGRFLPRSTPMHGDIWKSNVLRGNSRSAPFTLIDWRGSRKDGFPIFDLIRAAQSFRLSARALSRQLRFHQAALGCQPEDLPVYLLGALGQCAEQLGEMPPALFQSMADDGVTRLSSALAVSTAAA